MTSFLASRVHRRVVMRIKQLGGFCDLVPFENERVSLESHCLRFLLSSLGQLVWDHTPSEGPFLTCISSCPQSVLTPLPPPPPSPPVRVILSMLNEFPYPHASSKSFISESSDACPKLAHQCFEAWCYLWHSPSLIALHLETAGSLESWECIPRCWQSTNDFLCKGVPTKLLSLKIVFLMSATGFPIHIDLSWVEICELVVRLTPIVEF